MQARDRHYVDGVTCVLDGHAMRVANLGTGGLFAATELRPPDPGQLVVLELRIPRYDPFRVVGQVTWINEPRNPAAMPPGFGVKITRIDSHDKAAVQELLKRSDAVLSGPRSGH